MQINNNDGRAYKLVPIGSMDRSEWAARYAKWVNNEEVTKFLYQGTIPTSRIKCEALYDLWTNDNHAVFNIVYNEQAIGVVGVYNIYWPSRVGEFRILIGDKYHWGKGVGKAALEVMNEVAFERLNLYKFWLGFNASHKRAEGAYSKSGFQKECVIKRHHFKNGVYNDLVRMAMWPEDYEAWKNSKQD